VDCRAFALIGFAYFTIHSSVDLPLYCELSNGASPVVVVIYMNKDNRGGFHESLPCLAIAIPQNIIVPQNQ